MTKSFKVGDLVTHKIDRVQRFDFKNYHPHGTGIILEVSEEKYLVMWENFETKIHDGVYLLLK